MTLSPGSIRVVSLPVHTAIVRHISILNMFDDISNNRVASKINRAQHCLNLNYDPGEPGDVRNIQSQADIQL